MEFFDDGWDDDEPDDPDVDVDPEGFYLSLIPDEERRRLGSERAWSSPSDDEDLTGALHDRILFDRGTEAELHSEMRLSELWDVCQRGCLTLDEFLELSTLIAEVEGIPGSLCARLRHAGAAELERELVARHHRAVPGASPLSPGLCPHRRRRRPVPGLALPGAGVSHRTPPQGVTGGRIGAVTLAARVFAASHLTGSFVLRSGRTADHYFDKYRFESDPDLLADIVEALVPLLPPGDGGAGRSRARRRPPRHDALVGHRPARVLRPQAAKEIRHRACLRGRRGHGPAARDHRGRRHHRGPGGVVGPGPPVGGRRRPTRASASSTARVGVRTSSGPRGSPWPPSSPSASWSNSGADPAGDDLWPCVPGRRRHLFDNDCQKGGWSR